MQIPTPKHSQKLILMDFQNIQITTHNSNENLRCTHDIPLHVLKRHACSCMSLNMHVFWPLKHITQIKWVINQKQINQLQRKQPKHSILDDSLMINPKKHTHTHTHTHIYITHLASSQLIPSPYVDINIVCIIDVQHKKNSQKNLAQNKKENS